MVVRTGNREELEVRSPAGDVEVRIAFDASGPVVTVRGGRLEIESPDLALRCDRLSIDAKREMKLATPGDVKIDAGGEMRVKTDGDVRMNGAFIRLNCTE